MHSTIRDCVPGAMPATYRERRAALKKRAVVRLRKGPIRPPFPQYMQNMSQRVLKEAVSADGRWLRGSRIYLVEFQGVDQYVKVGRVGSGRSPAGPDQWLKRIRHHESIAAVHGCALVDAWVSVPIQQPERVEANLLQEIRAVPGVNCVSREYFQGLPFEQAVEVTESRSDWGWAILEATSLLG
ncbi:hypothetical protein [Streptomyces sp. NPDC001348]